MLKENDLILEKDIRVRNVLSVQHTWLECHYPEIPVLLLMIKSSFKTAHLALTVAHGTVYNHRNIPTIYEQLNEDGCY